MNAKPNSLPDHYDWRAAFRIAEQLSPDAPGPAKAARGREFEKILLGMLGESGLQPRLGYRPRGEEVDGSAWLYGRTMIIEAKWTTDPHPASSLYQFRGKVDGKLAGTLGLFISMAGFSSDAVDTLIAGKELNLILMDGDDVRTIADGQMTMLDALNIKLRAAGDSGTPFFPLRETLRRPPQNGKRIVLVGGRFDVRVLEIVRSEYGATVPMTILPSGGPANMVPLAQALSTEMNDVQSITMIVDGDGLRPPIEGSLRDAVAAADERTSAEVIVVYPDLDEALGLIAKGSTWNERRHLRRMSEDGLRDVIREADVLAQSMQTPAVASILRTIGVQAQKS